MKKILLISTLVIMLLSATTYKNDLFEIAKQIEIFTTLFKELNMNYVDETNPANLMDNAIKNMLSDLDPYTIFMNEQDVEQARINQTGEYTGIGAAIKTQEDKLIIVEPFKDYAADRAGLKAGDEIIKINNESLLGFKGTAADLLNGTPGSSLDITYLRQGKTNSVKLTRESVPIKAVPLYGMVNEKTGYVALTKFSKSATRETLNAIKSLKIDGATQLILDLRGNPGGLLHEAVNIVNLFVPKDELVVTTKSKVDKYNKTYYTTGKPFDVDIPLVVLIDGGSASASEIVSGSLQDLDRAVILGSRSFGKGLVQRPKPLTYGTHFKVTISRYYTPSGRCIQALDYQNRDKKGNAVRTKQEAYTAFKTKNGRTVYDGGGIKPDVGLNNSVPSNITKAIIKSDLIFDYATDYYYKNTIADLGAFSFNDGDFSSFKSFLKKNNFDYETKTEKALDKAMDVAFDEELVKSLSKDYNKLMESLKTIKLQAIDDNKEQISRLLKHEIIKRYFYREGLHEYYLKHNPEIKLANEILSNSKRYNGYLN